MHLVTVVAERTLGRDEQAIILKQVFAAAGMGQVTQLDTQGKTMKMALRSRPAVAKVLAAGLTLHGTALTVLDGEPPRRPPGIRTLLVNLPLGWTIEQVRKNAKGVRHVVPHRWRDETGTETSIWLTSATVWLEPDTAPVRHIKFGDRKATFIDPRLPKGKRRRRNRGRKGRGKKDKGKAAEGLDETKMDTSSAPPTSSSGPSTSAPLAPALSPQRTLFSFPPSDLTHRVEEWQMVAKKNKKAGSSSSSDSDAPPTVPKRLRKRPSFGSTSDRG